MKPEYFKAVKKPFELGDLEKDLYTLGFDSFSPGKAKNGRELFRLFKSGKKVGIIVVMNNVLHAEVTTIIERNQVCIGKN